MADLSYNVDVETQRAVANLKALRSESVNVTGALTGLVSVVGAINLAKFTDGITSAINKLKIIAPTVEEANRQFEGLAAIAIRARAPVEAVADIYFRIARGAQALGISQAEAATITESVAKGLAASGLSAEQAAGPLLQLGQALQAGRFAGDELRSILEGLPIVAEALARKLNVPVGALKDLGAQGKITGRDFVEAMQESKDAIDAAFGKTSPTIGQGIENLKTQFGLLISEVDKASGFSETFNNIILLLIAEMRLLTKNVDDVLGPIKTFIQALAFIASFTIAGKAIRGITAAIAALRAGIGSALPLLGKFGAGIAGWLGVDAAADKLKEVNKEGTDSANMIKQLKEELAGLSKTQFSQAKPSGPAPQYVDPAAVEKAKADLQKITSEYQRSLDTQTRRLSIENELVGVGEKQKAVRTALADLEEDYLRTVAQLTEKYNKLRISGKEEDRAAMAEVQVQLQAVTGAYEAQIGSVKRLTEENQRLNEAYLQRKALSEFTTTQEIDGQRRLREIQKDIASSTMTTIQKKYADIAFAASESARAAIASENRRRRELGLTKMSTEEEAKYFEAAMKGNQDLMAAERMRYEQSRSFDTGWKQAMNDYVENAGNAAARAKELFTTATKGMEDAIVNFAKTGKFEFKSFVSDILQMLLRSQIQQTMAKIFNTGNLGGGGGGGSFLGSIGKLLGFANGGIIPTNAPVVVGEKGPELLVGAAGNRVIPNNQLGGATQVVYNINAVDAPSFQALVARDPGFIHAVAMAGAGQTAGRR